MTRVLIDVASSNRHILAHFGLKADSGFVCVFLALSWISLFPLRYIYNRRIWGHAIERGTTGRDSLLVLVLLLVVLECVVCRRKTLDQPGMVDQGDTRISSWTSAFYSRGIAIPNLAFDSTRCHGPIVGDCGALLATLGIVALCLYDGIDMDTLAIDQFLAGNYTSPVRDVPIRNDYH